MKKLSALFLASVLFLSSCATSIKVQILRPAQLEINNAKTIAVLPFKTSTSQDDSTSFIGAVIQIIDLFVNNTNASADENNIVNYVTSSLEDGLASSAYITLVSSSSVSAAITNQTEVPVDVYLTGRISSFKTDIDKGYRTETDKKGNKKKIRTYTREAQITIRYQVINAKTNTVISSKSRSYSSSSSSYDDRSDVPSAYSILKSSLSTFVRTILHEVQPYVETKSFTFLETKDENMKEAKKLVKKDINAAYLMYMNIYQQQALFEAGYNAALIIQAQGKLAEAKTMMETLCSTYNDSRAFKALSDINNEIYQAERLQGQIGK
jgi:hypothetical protein